MKTLRFIVLMLAGFTVLTVWNSCKKGSEDPFFSIHSRLQRVCGDWHIVEYKVDFVDSLRRVIDSSVVNGPCGLETDKEIHNYNYTWSFDKHGGFTSKLVLGIDLSVDILNNTATCVDGFSHDSTIVVTVQSWNFTAGVGDYKNKEQFYLFDPDTKTAQIFDIVECREKEMKLQTQYVDPVSNVATLRTYTLKSI